MPKKKKIEEKIIQTWEEVKPGTFVNGEYLIKDLGKGSDNRYAIFKNGRIITFDKTFEKAARVAEKDIDNNE